MGKKDGLVFNDDWHDELARLLDEHQPNNRHDIWLWLHLCRDEQAGFDPASCNGRTMRNEIARWLKDKTDLRTDIPSLKDRRLVPDAKLKWVDEGERQYRWLLHRVVGITASRPPRELPDGLEHLTDKNRFIAMLDLWGVNLKIKSDAIEDLRNAWCKHKAKDRDFEWFEDKKDGARRCKCAWEWLEKNHTPLPEEQRPISNYQELLMFFDQAYLRSYEQKTMIQEIKKRWSRQQFDDRNADKKQVNIMLSKTVITLLDELAKKHDQKRAQVLEHLITMASEQGMIEKTLHPSRTGRGSDRDRQQ
ncbi:hypothetical protein HX870_10265 [Pseudomonas gingeri]|uniref:hypothetical protein n=1 Tax=Pseudomonas gingeri TaxID=117681 RepID=UPI0015A05FDF|nr:hypothetical protein [Pseudomonas gingeri]NWA29191.1 hypothetical protein [Pseudomonas gingeri]NWD67980.1 hypothetical protein [Pseudomonas gingeri]